MIVVRSTMPHTPIIPDRQVVFPPLEPHLCVVILRHDVEQVPEQQVGLIFRDAVDPLGESLVHVYGLPSGDGYECVSRKERSTAVESITHDLSV